MPYLSLRPVSRFVLTHLLYLIVPPLLLTACSAGTAGPVISNLTVEAIPSLTATLVPTITPAPTAMVNTGMVNATNTPQPTGIPKSGLDGADRTNGLAQGSTLSSTWALVWNDEFDGLANASLNSANWLYDIGTSGCQECPANWGTGEVESMTNSTANVYLDGAGHLVIKPIRDSKGAWTSGRIETQRLDFHSPTSGTLAVEASIQQPNISGTLAAGYWPAFWMLGAPVRGNPLNWPSAGEIDIMENVNGLSSIIGTLHCGTYPGRQCNEPTGISSGQRPCPGCQTGFHIYRVELDTSVTPQQIRWYLDNVIFFTVNSNQVGEGIDSDNQMKDYDALLQTECTK